MPKIAYIDRNFKDDTLAVIDQANEIIAEFAADGYDLTLRQLYYQFVSRDLIANKQTEYSRLGSIINDARLAGLIDWDAITDRTRNLAALSHWEKPEHILAAVAEQYREEKWATQPRRIEVWIEKDALAGVFQRVCEELDVAYFSCRGYTSQSEMWAAAQRLRRYERAGQETVILHFGDHDPSGLDMTRDIQDRLSLFRSDVAVDRLALTRAQIDQYQPPPNPAKVTDSRFERYQQEHGNESWELDALRPDVLAGLVRDAVTALRDEALWDAAVAEETHKRRSLRVISAEYENIIEYVAADIEALPDEGSEDD